MSVSVAVAFGRKRTFPEWDVIVPDSLMGIYY